MDRKEFEKLMLDYRESGETIGEIEANWMDKSGQFRLDKYEIRYNACIREMQEIEAKLWEAISNNHEVETCTLTEIDQETNAWECSECGEVWQILEGDPRDNNMNYCQNCGRRVEEVIPYQRYDDIDE